MDDSTKGLKLERSITKPSSPNMLLKNVSVIKDLPTPVIPSKRIFTSGRNKEATRISKAVISVAFVFKTLALPLNDLTSM